MNRRVNPDEIIFISMAINSSSIVIRSTTIIDSDIFSESRRSIPTIVFDTTSRADPSALKWRRKASFHLCERVDKKLVGTRSNLEKNLKSPILFSAVENADRERPGACGISNEAAFVEIESRKGR